MKLRNKKTGDIWEFVSISMKIFDEEWEDAEPKEPLIKDEKIRKAVRAWADAVKGNTIRFDRFTQGFSFGDGNLYSSINFDGFVFDLVDGKKYTIDELCGEDKNESTK